MCSSAAYDRHHLTLTTGAFGFSVVRDMKRNIPLITHTRCCLTVAICGDALKTPLPGTWVKAPIDAPEPSEWHHECCQPRRDPSSCVWPRGARGNAASSRRGRTLPSHTTDGSCSCSRRQIASCTRGNPSRALADQKPTARSSNAPPAGRGALGRGLDDCRHLGAGQREASCSLRTSPSSRASGGRSTPAQRLPCPAR
jgi:hypothetical protein